MSLAKKLQNPLTLVLVLSGLFFVLFLVISGAIFLSNKGTPSSKSGGALFSYGSVGVVEVTGVIMDSKKTIARLQRFEDDDNIKAVVLRVNSPGGAVAPSQEIYDKVRKFKKPVVASMASVAASGGYYISCGAKKIFANAGTITGSIGVIMEFANLEKLYEWAKIQRYAIKTGKYKNIGAEYKPMSPEERALVTSMIEDVLGQFKRAVVDGRKMSMAEVDKVADGRIMSGQQAKQVKLVDQVGTLNDAIDEAGRMAKIKGKPSVVYVEKGRRKILDFILDNPTDEDASSSFSASPIGSFVAQIFGHKVIQGLEDNLSLAPGIYWLWPGLR